MTTHIPMTQGAPDGDESGKKDPMKDILRAMHEVLPMLDQMKNTIQESSSSIPKASTQLKNVTQATETATVEILNVLDSMTRKFEGVDAFLNGIRAEKEQLRSLGEPITAQLHVVAAGSPESKAAQDSLGLWSQYFAAATNADALATATVSINDARNDAMSIAMALQVQDITSQQIAGVVHLIESVRTQLADVLLNFENDVAKPAAVATLPVPKTFDGNAEFTRSPERQNMADDIINQWNQSAGTPS